MKKKSAKMSMMQKIDTLKSLDENEQVSDYSDESDDNEDFQPKKKKVQKKYFAPDFQFVSSAKEYNKDTWDDLTKYVRRKVRSKTDDKIQKARRNLKGVAEEEDEIEEENNADPELSNLRKGKDSDDEIVLSEDELKHDDIKLKEKLIGKKKRKKLAAQRKFQDSDDENHNGITVEQEDDENDEFFDDAPPFDENTTFYQMNLSRPLMKAIGQLNYVQPTPIQAATIPTVLLGRDVCGCAATGTGKTAAYMLPVLERLLFRPVNDTAVTRVLVLVPTRELGVQVYQVSKQLAQFTSIEIGLSVGGLELKYQEAVLRKNPDIVIATPGRLIDHLKNTPSFTLIDVEILVLDEADRMLDENFKDQMTEIIKMCSRTRQTLLFSATMTEEVQDLVSLSLTKPVKIFVDSNKDVAFNLRQEFIRLRKDKEDDREAILAALVCRTFRDHTIVFVATKAQAHKVHILLGLLGLKVGELHGNLTQPQRLENLKKFKDEELDILVATDVAARGLDIRGVKTVINFMMPTGVDKYIHRVGRTARAGRAGVSVSIVCESERKIFREIVKRAKNSVKSRSIPQDIIDKYKERVSALSPEVEKIMKEEYEERQLAKVENAANKAENLVKGIEKPRDWFQTGQKRKKAKADLRRKIREKRAEMEASRKGKKSKKVVDPETKKLLAEQKVHAKMAKSQMKRKKVTAYREKSTFGANGKQTNTKKSYFDDAFTNTSKKSADKFRAPANQKIKISKAIAKKNKGKVFGKPTPKKNPFL
ncbi:unnamed protein product [Bemisia tabaci]|uniref:RNA helicase n=1 Tax=Bemisia tabaci TaxID=7038 RepID=A0A9P0F6V4_BEMTA|nr:PREDICTED: probable ATP-dependent RNA helicase DDX27 [Bemisia tabaci]CAH0390424.1 unnamed protein product [Bemisia tabaci]